jgi:hypothetical protein
MSIASYYDSLIEKTENAQSCIELEGLGVETFAIYTDQLAAINDQIAALEPLLVRPGLNLNSIRDWIDAMIAVFEVPATTLPLQIIEVQAKWAEYVIAFNDKKTGLSCTF